jgi:hypothetical protein
MDWSEIIRSMVVVAEARDNVTFAELNDLIPPNADAEDIERLMSARPRHHAQAEGAVEDFKKSSQRAWMKSRAKRQSMLEK